MLARADTPTITSIETALLTLPLRGSRHGGGAGVEPISHLLVQVKLNDGTIGSAETPLRLEQNGETAEGAKVLLEHYFSKELQGKRVEPALKQLWQLAAYNYSSKAALDIALHDAQARSQGQSLWDVVNPALVVRQDCLVPVSYQLEWGQTDTGLEPIFAEVEQIIAQGVNRFKVLLRKDSSKDIERLSLLSQSFSEALFYVDAQGNLMPDNAAHKLEQLRDIGVQHVADPLPQQRIKERALLKSEAIVPIVAANYCQTPELLQLESSFDTFDILAINPCQTGLGRSLAMMQYARDHQHGLLVESGGTSGLGTLYAVMLASRPEVTHPCELSYPLKFSRDTITPSLHYEDGFLDVAQLLEGLPRVAPF